MQALIDELKKPEYQGMTDVQAAAAINAKVVPVRVHVDCWMAKQHALENGYFAPLYKASKDPSNPYRDLAISVLAYIDDSAGKFQKIDLDRPKVREMLAGIVQSQMASQSIIDDLIALADSHVAWVDHVGIGQVGIGLIQNARKQIVGGSINAQ